MALLGLASWGVEGLIALFRSLARMVARTVDSGSAADPVVLETWQCHACGTSIRSLSNGSARCPRCGERLLRICLVGA